MESGRRIFTFPILSAALLTLQSILLLQFPLLNILGLEFSVASSPLVALLAGLLILKSPEDFSKHPYRRLFSSLRNAWYFIAIPGALALGNAIFVRNCSPIEGLAYYLLILPFSAAFGMSAGLLARSLSPRSSRIVFLLVWGVCLLHIPAVTFLGPQIFAYNPIVGYFPGLSYDSTISVLPSLVGYRVLTTLLIIAILETVRCSDRPFTGRITSMWINFRTVIITWALILAAFFASDTLGFSSSLSRIEKELGGVVRTEHFLILYPSYRMDDLEALRFAEYHEFLFRDLTRTLRVRTSRPIISIYYDSPRQKSRLIGGGSTNFTKPWLWQMHLTYDDRDRVLKHELVHVIAAEFGFPLIRVGLNSGFIEGLAVALERESYGMSLDRAAASILNVRGSADVSRIFSITGFFGSHASVSYALAGSFCRYLIERFGVRRFKQAYRSGSFEAFGRTFAVLEAEWKKHISGIQLTEDELLKARFLFDRPPAFSAECFQYRGNTLRDARAALRNGNDSLGAVIAEEAYMESPSFEAAYVRIQALTRMGNMTEALQVAEEQTKRDPDREYLPLALVVGDALWGIDSVVTAREYYEKVRRADLSDGWTETAAFRLSMLERYPKDDSMRNAVIRSQSDSTRRAFFRSQAVKYDDPLIWYALSRWSSAIDREDELLDVLPRAGHVDDSFLRFVITRRLSSILRSRKEYEKGKAVLWEAQNEVHDEVRLREIVEGIEWMDWLKERVP